jgi:hypothetical protein
MRRVPSVAVCASVCSWVSSRVRKCVFVGEFRPLLCVSSVRGRVRALYLHTCVQEGTLNTRLFSLNVALHL